MAWCKGCTCCEVREIGDFCCFCEDGLICPRRRYAKERLAKAAAKVFKPKRKYRRRKLPNEESAIRATTRSVEKQAARERRKRARELDAAKKKLAGATDTFIAAVAGVEFPADESRPA